MRGPALPPATRSSARIGTGENFRMVSVGPRSERGGMIAWTREPSGSRASAQGDDSSTRRPKGPTIRSIRCRTDSSPSNSPSGALSIRPSRSTYTSSGPFTMTSVTSGAFSRNSMGPNPTTSSETSLTTSVSWRCGRMAPLARSSDSASSRTRTRRSVRGTEREPAHVHAPAQLIAELPSHQRQRVGIDARRFDLPHPSLLARSTDDTQHEGKCEGEEPARPVRPDRRKGVRTLPATTATTESPRRPIRGSCRGTVLSRTGDGSAGPGARARAAEHE